MAPRLPLVLGPDFLPQQLQPSDTIFMPTTSLSLRAVSNAESSAAVPFGTPVYASGADAVKRGQANAKATSRIVGLAFDPGGMAAGATGLIAVNGVLPAATTALWDAITGGTGGLAFGATYFLDPANPGKITAAPVFTAGSGQCAVVIGTALSTLELELQIALPILL